MTTSEEAAMDSMPVHDSVDAPADMVELATPSNERYVVLVAHRILVRLGLLKNR